MTGTIIAVTGTRREASVLKGAGLVVLAGGGDAAGLARQIASHLPGAAGIISFGMCGGLDRALKPGQWVIGKRLVGAFPATCDEAWARALAARLPAARLGAIHADGTLIASADDKLAIANASAALAVDMESHIAARAAAEAGLPFAILRCVSDDAHAELPPAIRLAMRPDGALAVGAMLGSVLRQPGQVPALTRTLAGFAGAFRELAQGAQKVGPGLAFEER